MCKAGDIIVVYKPLCQNKNIGTHPFVVLNEDGGKIKGIEFDFVGLLMSSIDTEEKHKKLMKYKANFPITTEEQDIAKGKPTKSCIKADQLYFFNEDKIKYKVLGKLDKDIFELLNEFIEELRQDDAKFRIVLDNT